MSTPDGPDDDLDIDAAWESIVAGWGEEAPHADTAPPAATPVVQPEEELELPGEFIPPVPPPLSRSLSPQAALTWLLICGPPVVLLVAGFAGWELSHFRAGLAAATFMCGCGLLVRQLRDAEDDPPPDDGAVV